MGKITLNGKEISKPFPYKGRNVVKLTMNGKDLTFNKSNNIAFIAGNFGTAPLARFDADINDQLSDMYTIKGNNVDIRLKTEPKRVYDAYSHVNAKDATPLRKFYFPLKGEWGVHYTIETRLNNGGWEFRHKTIGFLNAPPFTAGDGTVGTSQSNTWYTVADGLQPVYAYGVGSTQYAKVSIKIDASGYLTFNIVIIPAWSCENALIF